MEFVEPIRDKKKIEAMKRVLAKNPRDELLFIFGINTALRISDILRINFNDVYEDDDSVRERFRLKEKKTGKRKNVIISSSLKTALEKYILLHPGADPAGPLFYSRKGSQAIKRQHAYRILTDAAEMVGLDHIGTHTLRKTWAYHAYKAGYHVSRIQKALNHSSPSITMAYMGIDQDDIDEMFSEINL